MGRGHPGREGAPFEGIACLLMSLCATCRDLCLMHQEI